MNESRANSEASKSQNESLQQLLEYTERLSHFSTLNDHNLLRQQKSNRESYDMAQEVKRILVEKSLDILHFNHILKNIPQISADFHMRTLRQVQRMDSLLHDTHCIHQFSPHPANPVQALSYAEDPEPQSSDKETWFRKNVNVTFYKAQARQDNEPGDETKRSEVHSVQ